MVSSLDAALRAEDLFVRGKAFDDELLRHATTAWETFGPAASGIAEVARFARIAAYRRGLRSAELWQARHVSAAAVSGAWRSMALALQPSFYRLLETHDVDAAERVLVEMERLAGRDHYGPPAASPSTGILAKRRGLLCTEAERWDEAVDAYERAGSYATPRDRRALKVDGGLARSRWKAGGTATAAAEVLQRLMLEG